MALDVAHDLGALFAAREDDIDLGRAAAMLARLEYPDLEPADCVAELDALAEEAAERVDPATRREIRLSALNQALFERMGFTGNRRDYFDPRNSFLNDVLRRRTGIPISLSVVYIEVARRLDLPIFGVGLPGHFVAKYDDRSRIFFVDPFHDGRVLNRRGCEDLVRTIHGRDLELNENHFAAVTKRQIITRMCNNLRGIYVSTRRYDKALEALEINRGLGSLTAEDLKQRAWLHYETGRRSQALADLESYRRARPEGSDAAEIEAWISNIRRTLARLN